MSTGTRRVYENDPAEISTPGAKLGILQWKFLPLRAGSKPPGWRIRSINIVHEFIIYYLAYVAFYPLVGACVPKRKWKGPSGQNVVTICWIGSKQLHNNELNLKTNNIFFNITDVLLCCWNSCISANTEDIEDEVLSPTVSALLGKARNPGNLSAVLLKLWSSVTNSYRRLSKLSVSRGGGRKLRLDREECRSGGKRNR